ncbi:MAG: hypothetical protein HDS10_07935 [Bacteroides sp.]|nr:hypothetical protein [Bacteroides sp.]
MIRKITRMGSILMIALVGILSTGCMPRVYDDNPHFSHHRNPPKPIPPRPVMPPKPAPGKPGTPAKPTPQPSPNQPAPGRPGTNNHR